MRIVMSGSQFLSSEVAPRGVESNPQQIDVWFLQGDSNLSGRGLAIDNDDMTIL